MRKWIKSESKLIPKAQEGLKFKQDNTRVNNNAQNKIFRLEKDLNLNRLSDQEFKERYKASKHQYKYNSDPNYKSEVQERNLIRKNNDPNYSQVDLPSTNRMSKSYQGNPNAKFQTGNTSPGEHRADRERFHADIISTGLPVVPYAGVKAIKNFNMNNVEKMRKRFMKNYTNNPEFSRRLRNTYKATDEEINYIKDNVKNVPIEEVDEAKVFWSGRHSGHGDKFKSLEEIKFNKKYYENNPKAMDHIQKLSLGKVDLNNHYFKKYPKEKEQVLWHELGHNIQNSGFPFIRELKDKNFIKNVQDPFYENLFEKARILNTERDPSLSYLLNPHEIHSNMLELRYKMNPKNPLKKLNAKSLNKFLDKEHRGSEIRNHAEFLGKDKYLELLNKFPGLSLPIAGATYRTLINNKNNETNP